MVSGSDMPAFLAFSSHGVASCTGVAGRAASPDYPEKVNYRNECKLRYLSKNI